MNNKKSFLLRIDRDLWDKLKLWAEEESRSVNNQIEFILKQAVQKKTEKQQEKSTRHQPGSESLEIKKTQQNVISGETAENINPEESPKKSQWIGYEEIPD